MGQVMGLTDQETREIARLAWEAEGLTILVDAQVISVPEQGHGKWVQAWVWVEVPRPAPKDML